MRMILYLQQKELVCRYIYHKMERIIRENYEEAKI